MKLIDKDALVAEIERRKEEEVNYDENGGYASWADHNHFSTLDSIQDFLNTLEVKEVDLYHELDKYFERFKGLEKINWNWRIDSINVHAQGIYDFAKYFFELGVKANQENNIIGTLEREVKIDAGGYPYINCDIEFYDYDKDIPLAKEGDKVKVVLVKGE